MKRILATILGFALLTTLVPLGQAQSSSAPAASPVLNGGFEAYADAFGEDSDEDDSGNDEALLWSHWVREEQVETTAFATDADDDPRDREMVVSPCMAQDKIQSCSSHNAWQSVTYAQAWALPANYQSYEFTIEVGAEHVADARNPHVNNVLLLPPEADGTLNAVIISMDVPRDVDNGLVSLDPTDASASDHCCVDTGEGTQAWLEAWRNGDEQDRRLLLAEAHILQHGFWDLNYQGNDAGVPSGDIVIDDVAIDYAPDLLPSPAGTDASTIPSQSGTLATSDDGLVGGQVGLAASPS